MTNKTVHKNVCEKFSLTYVVGPSFYLFKHFRLMVIMHGMRDSCLSACWIDIHIENDGN